MHYIAEMSIAITAMHTAAIAILQSIHHAAITQSMSYGVRQTAF